MTARRMSQADRDEAQLQLELARGYLRDATDALNQVNLPVIRRPGLNRLVHAVVAAEAAVKTMDWLIDNAPVEETPEPPPGVVSLSQEASAALAERMAQTEARARAADPTLQKREQRRRQARARLDANSYG